MKRVSVVDNLSDVLKNNNIDKSEISKAKSYIEASEIYNSLIKSGFVKPRGNNLLSKDKVYQNSFKFNQ